MTSSIKEKINQMLYLSHIIILTKKTKDKNLIA